MDSLIQRTLVSLHEAALDDVHWPVAARLVIEASGTEGNAIVCGAGRFQAEADLFFVRLFFREQRSEDWQRRYFEEHWLEDESIPRIAFLPYGELIHTADLYTDQEKKSSRAYNEARREARMQKGLTVRLTGPRGSHVVWNLADSIEPGGWSSTQIETIGFLLPHVRQFVCVRQALADAGALGSPLAALLDNARFGVIQLDGQGRIVAANDQAQGHLRDRDALFDSGGFLRCRMPTVDARLQRLLARAVPPFGTPAAAGSMTIKRAPPAPKLMVHVNPVAEREWDVRSQKVAVLVLVVDPERRPRIDPDHVASALDLTPAESRLAVMLATGRSLREIAEATSRTEGTVRWHLKQIFRKRGFSRQADLVRCVLSFDGLPDTGT